MKTSKMMILAINEIPEIYQKPVALFLAQHGTTSLIGGKNPIKCPKNIDKSIREQLKQYDNIDLMVKEAMLWVEKTFNLEDIDSVMIDRIKSQEFMRQENDDIEIDHEK